MRPRIAESIEAALRLAGGLVRVDVGPGEREHLLSERNACPDCGVSYPEIAPRMFSFNSPHGACPACAGLGTRPEFDARRVVPDESKSLAAGAISPWSGRRVPRYYAELLAGLAAHYGVSLETPWSKLPSPAREAILHGSGGEEIPFRVTRRGGSAEFSRRWDGVLGELARRFEAASELERDALARFRSEKPCAACEGTRLRPEARAVKLGGSSITDVCRLSVTQAARFFETLELGAAQRVIAERVLKEIRDRAGITEDIGSTTSTLERGSARSRRREQRIRLDHGGLEPDGRALHPRRALARPASARQPSSCSRACLGCATAGNSRDRRRARRGDYPRGRLRDRHGARPGIHGGTIVAQGTPRRDPGDGRARLTATTSPDGSRSRAEEARPPVPRALVDRLREHNLKEACCASARASSRW